MKRIGIVGFGVMGEAFAIGLRKKMPEVALAAFDVKRERIDAAAKTLGISRRATQLTLLPRTSPCCA